MKQCLDLFAGLGGFSQAFEESEKWEVTTIEINGELDPDIEADIMDLSPSDIPIEPDVILASPPCTKFSFAGNHDLWEDKKPLGEAREHVMLVYHTIGLIKALSPGYWFLENPRGRLRWILGEPEGTVCYCRYGKDYKKPTDLWGEHPKGMEYRYCTATAGSGCHIRNGSDDGTEATASMDTEHAERSKVPYELSKEILKAVEGKHTQESLTVFEQ